MKNSHGAILLAALIFGTGGLFVKTLDAPSTVVVAFRLFIPAIAILIFCRDLRIRLLTQPSRTLAVASACTAVRVLFWVLALRYASITKVIFILYTWPVIFTIFQARFFGERVSRKGALLLAISFCGIATLYVGEPLHPDNHEIIGMGCMLIVAFLNATILTVFKRALKTHSPLEVVMYDNLVGGIIFLPFALYHYNTLSLTTVTWGGLYGIVIGFLAYWLLYYGMARVPAILASILCYMEVISATVIGVIVFGEAITWRVVVGGSLILASATMAHRMRGKLQG